MADVCGGGIRRQTEVSPFHAAVVGGRQPECGGLFVQQFLCFGVDAAQQIDFFRFEIGALIQPAQP